MACRGPISPALAVCMYVACWGGSVGEVRSVQMTTFRQPIIKWGCRACQHVADLFSVWHVIIVNDPRDVFANIAASFSGNEDAVAQPSSAYESEAVFKWNVTSSASTCFSGEGESWVMARAKHSSVITSVKSKMGKKIPCAGLEAKTWFKWQHSKGTRYQREHKRPHAHAHTNHTSL